MAEFQHLEWNQLQLKIALLLQQGATPLQIAKSGLCNVRTVYKVKKNIESGDNPPDLSEAAIAAAPPPKKFGKHAKKAPKGDKGDGDIPILLPSQQGLSPGTTETTEATALRLTPRVQTIPLTPGIFISYMCAVARGFEGDMAAFLDLSAVDFWTGRGVNPFEEVSRVSIDQVPVEAGEKVAVEAG